MYVCMYVHCAGQTQSVQCTHQRAAPFLHKMTSSLLSWKYDVTFKIKLCELMRMCLKKNPAKFCPDPIWNYEALGFYEEVTPTRTRWAVISDQFLIYKNGEPLSQPVGSTSSCGPPRLCHTRHVRTASDQTFPSVYVELCRPYGRLASPRVLQMPASLR